MSISSANAAAQTALDMARKIHLEYSLIDYHYGYVLGALNVAENWMNANPILCMSARNEINYLYSHQLARTYAK